MSRIIDLTGRRFGKIVVLRREGTYHWRSGSCPSWLCKCDCGRTIVVLGPNLRRGQASCTCIFVRHGEYSRGLSAEYRIWRGLITRCTNHRGREWPNYGGRGIRVCERWRADFNAFLADMGRRPTSAHSIDRIDNDGHYEPGNCRWATDTEQAANKRNNVTLTWRGRTLHLAEWARQLGIKKTTIRERLRRGWSHERALSTSVGGGT